MEPYFRREGGKVPYFSAEFLHDRVYLPYGGGEKGQKAVGVGDFIVRSI
jgi:hypothetical protein